MKKYILIGCSMAIHSCLFAQNVGVGTSSPLEKLHVAGNVKADTIKPNAIKMLPNAGMGKVLTSDAAGNATWQSTANNTSAGSVGFGPWGDCSVTNISEYNPVVDATGSTGDQFGSGSAISGNYAIVGAPQDDIGSNVDQGSASIYEFNGTNWVLMQKLTDATGAAGDSYGIGVSISGNYAIVGSYSDDQGANLDQGSASIYKYNGSSWVLMQKIVDPAGASVDYFGARVSISGNFALIGSFQDDVGAITNQGSASVFQFNGSNWVFMQKLLDATGAANDAFGASVSISGNYAVVGAGQDDVAGNIDQGSVSVFQYSGGTWVLMQKLTDYTPFAGIYFGCSVSVSGNYLIVGCYQDGSGANVPFGSASVYQYNGSNWVLMEKLLCGNRQTGEYFGYSVCISGNYALVGASGTQVGSSLSQGSATLFMRVGLGWKKVQYITDPGGSGANSFGTSVAIDGDSKRFGIGATGYGLGSGTVVFGKAN